MSNASRNISPLDTVKEKIMLNDKSEMSILERSFKANGPRTEMRGKSKTRCKVSYKLDMFRESRNSIGSN